MRHHHHCHLQHDPTLNELEDSSLLQLGGRLFKEQGENRVLANSQFRFGAGHSLSSFIDASGFRKYRSDPNMNVELINGRSQVATLANRPGTLAGSNDVTYGDR